MPAPRRAPREPDPPAERMDSLDAAQIGFGSEEEFDRLLDALEIADP